MDGKYLGEKEMDGCVYTERVETFFLVMVP